MTIHDFIIKLQSLSDSQKKAIIISAVVIVAFVCGFIWVRLSIERLNRLGEVTKDMKLPEVDMPKIELTEPQTPSTNEITK